MATFENQKIALHYTESRPVCVGLNAALNNRPLKYTGYNVQVLKKGTCLFGLLDILFGILCVLVSQHITYENL